MSGFGWGRHASQSALEVAKAFYEGRTLKRTSCRTDGERYFVYENVIARRLNIPARVARKLTDVYDMLDTTLDAPLEVSWSGWPTWTTARHLDALGFKAQPPYVINRKGHKSPPLIDGVACGLHEWCTPEYLKTAPRWEKPEPPPKQVWYPQREPFVNATLPLF